MKAPGGPGGPAAAPEMLCIADEAGRCWIMGCSEQERGWLGAASWSPELAVSDVNVGGGVASAAAGVRSGAVGSMAVSRCLRVGRRRRGARPAEAAGRRRARR